VEVVILPTLGSAKGNGNFNAGRNAHNQMRTGAAADPNQ
jgi:hypothetical protein